MEWLKQIILANTTDLKVDVDAVMNAVNKEFPNHAIPKDVYNQQAEKLKEANKTLDTLKKSNKDNEDIQKELETYKDKVKTLEENTRELTKTSKLKEALLTEKATDIDYLTYKLGNIELDDEGNIKDLDSKIKDLKENYGTFFESESSSSNSDKVNTSFTKIDNANLPAGDTLSKEEIISQEFEKSLGL